MKAKSEAGGPPPVSTPSDAARPQQSGTGYGNAVDDEHHSYQSLADYKALIYHVTLRTDCNKGMPS
ncbi:MAG: hypothetical protein Alpg2KO_32700 [Alphaproteobacteria bacterium]